MYIFRNWCISRQLLWGHQIPAYFCIIDGKKDWIAAQSKDDAFKMFTERYGNDVQVHQDSDVLDTWFSSALLPLSSLGWPTEVSNKIIKRKKIHS